MIVFNSELAQEKKNATLKMPLLFLDGRWKYDISGKNVFPGFLSPRSLHYRWWEEWGLWK